VLAKKESVEPYQEPVNSNESLVVPSHEEASIPAVNPVEPLVSSPVQKEYTVQSGDTLQKISQKLYGTTKKWHKLYLLNQDILKSPDKIHPGMIIKVIDKEQP
jgi:nucleoid-associated protein YgaU